MTDGGAGPRLLVLTTTFPARRGDGTPAFVLTLAEAMAAATRPTVLAPRVDGASARESWGAVRVRRFAYFPRRWEVLAQDAIMPTLRARPWTVVQAPCLVLAMLVATLREVRRGVDAIHAHWLVPAGLVAAVVARATGVPFVLTVHGADAHTLTGPVLERLKRWVVRQATAVVPVSHEIADRLGLPRASAVPIGVDFEQVAADVGRRAPRPGRFLFVGRLAAKKGVDVLLRAAAAVPGATVRVVGDGPDRPRLERLARSLGVDDRVVFLGRLGRDGVMAELAEAAALVVPSVVAADGDRDGTPVVMMEAVAARVPVIASSLAGLGQYVLDRETGHAVAPGDADALAARMRAVVEDPAAAARFAATAHERWRDELDVRAVATVYLSALPTATGVAGGRR